MIAVLREGCEMVRLHTTPAGPGKMLVDRAELDRLIEAARQVEDVELIEGGDDVSTEGLMRLVEGAGSFEHLLDPREDIYSVNDLKVRYR
jgi:hypothetical protein